VGILNGGFSHPDRDLHPLGAAQEGQMVQLRRVLGDLTVAHATAQAAYTTHSPP
jgi:hypothetical protein